MSKLPRIIVAVACCMLGIWITPRYDIKPVEYPQGLKPRCSITRIGKVIRVHNLEELQRAMPEISAGEIQWNPNYKEYTIIRDWHFDCTGVLTSEALIEVDDSGVRSGGYTIGELELISTFDDVRKIEINVKPSDWKVIENSYR